MASIHRFEDIEAWREARELTKAIYGLTREGRFSRDRGLADQIQRATVSILANIVEGFDSGSNLEFVRFLGYARRSASEAQAILYVALDQAYITEGQFSTHYAHAEKIRRMVTAFSRYLKTQQRALATTRKLANTPTR